MSKLSTRVTDDKLIELAKQNYEKQQTSKIPGIIINLPTKGLVYPESNPARSGQLEMRYMTAYDEDILTNITYLREGIMFDKLIQSLVITPGFNVNTLVEADKEWLILSARISGYGAEYKVIITDPTGKSDEHVVDLNKIKIANFDLQSDEKGEFHYEIDTDWNIKYRYLSKSVLDKTPEESAVSYFLEQTIREINGKRDPEYIKTFIKTQLTPIESRKLRKHIQETTPSIKMEYVFTYVTAEGKEETFQSVFPIGPDFFWL